LRDQANVPRSDEETGREAIILALQDQLKENNAEIAAKV
jgi:hypothetical protein